MKRFVFGLVGTALSLVPALFFFTVLVPVSEYRTGTYADVAGAVVSGVTLYGGEAIGILVLWWRGTPTRFTGRDVFHAGAWGGVIAISAAITGHGVYRWFTGDSVGVGNLWGLVVIFGTLFSVMVAAGAGITWHGLCGSHHSTQV